MAKYKQAVKEMLESHPDLFNNFTQIHVKYVDNPEAHQKEFNETGQQVLNVIQETEADLCSRSNQSQYSVYATQLSDKFRAEVKAIFPKLDYIGLE